MNKYSFNDILENSITIQDEKNNEIHIKIDKIEIPKIQRDYAQGRDSQTEVRKRFLNSIFEVLENRSEIEMDFIYGSVKEIELDNKQKNNIFIPLDGQQRLTTLYLLYWYIGNRELEEQDRINHNILLQKFTYETRTSSRRFCEKITETVLAFVGKPSDEIKNLPWFYKSYKQDPTIKAMLNMLDAIHEKYGQEPKNYYKNLQNLQFYILPLNGFHLTDELYVKMNARGKQLTDFENFKADLIKWMKSDDNPYKTDFQNKVELDGREMPYYLSFSQKIDSKWSKFLGTLLKELGNNEYQIEETDKSNNKLNPGEAVDLLFIRIFYRYFLQNYYLIFNAKFERSNKSIIITDSDEKISYETLLAEGKYQNFNAFQMILNKKNIILAFEVFLDTLSDKWDDIKMDILPSWTLEPQKWFFSKDITQPQRVVFMAISLSLEKNTFDHIQFKQWMRVVWNIVENTDIDGFQPMYGTMELINELSTKSTGIYSFLSDETNSIVSQSSSNAIAEERQKSTFIINSNTWEQIFVEAEKHPFFKGSVSFIITNDMTEDSFKHRIHLANKIFDENGISSDYRKNGHIFLRALISQYLQYSQIINRNFTDTDEKEHYLKKMLSSDEVVRNAIREWFDLADETALNHVLNDVVLKDSTISGWNSSDVSTKERTKQVHEALYKSPHLQDWMQNKNVKAFRVSWNGSHIWVSRPNSWYDWVMLDSARNEILTELCRKYNFIRLNDEQKEEKNIISVSSQIDYYWGKNNISVYGKNNLGGKLKITLNNDCILTIEKMDEFNNWIKIKDLDYVNNVIDVSNDILNQ